MSSYNDGGPAFPLPDDSNFRYPGMNLRQYAAIHLCVPNSGEEWLDNLIREAQRNELAVKAMQGWFENSDYTMSMRADMPFDQFQRKMCESFYAWADAMLAARGAA